MYVRILIYYIFMHFFINCFLIARWYNNSPPLEHATRISELTINHSSIGSWEDMISLHGNANTSRKPIKQDLLCTS